MADIQLWREAAAAMRLQGPEIIAFVREQQAIYIAREEHRMQLEDAQAQAQAQREHEL